MNPWRQRFKWTVFALLFVDFILYFIQDVESARYTLDDRSTFLDYASAYVTSIDLIAWFALILLFELETYVLVERVWTGATKWIVHGIRLACYATILHTSISYDYALREYHNPDPLPSAADVCAYADGGWSFLRNRDYLEIDRDNCTTIGRGPEFFAISDDAVITDRDGLQEGLLLAWSDFLESVAWLAVVFLTEILVRLKAGAIGSAATLGWLERGKIVLYVLIVAIALFWGSKQQYLYMWDEMIWVLGFLIIDWNIHEWRSWKATTLGRPLSASPPAA
jgi:hypothetical protein